jgi:hypothetical protein
MHGIPLDLIDVNSFAAGHNGVPNSLVRAVRLRRFLRHVAERYLDADLDGLKAYSIGLGDRGDAYDPWIDPIVRVGIRTGNR